MSDNVGIVADQTEKLPAIIPAEDFIHFSLEDLAERINTSYYGTVLKVRRLAIDVAQIGAYLSAVKVKCGHGNWLPWLAENCPDITRWTARRYMDLYRQAASNGALMHHLTPTEAYRKLLKASRPEPDLTPVEPPNLDQLPQNKYHTLVVDPPWEMQKIETDKNPSQYGFDYHTMTNQEIADFPVVPHLAAEDSHLYLWATHKHLPAAFGIAEAWGFRYECLLTWRKDAGFVPFSWMRSTEFALFCRRGSLQLSKLGKRLDLEARRSGHSRKPDQFYDLVKEVSPEPRIDVFSRQSRCGFEAWGNEVGKYDIPAGVEV